MTGRLDYLISVVIGFLAVVGVVAIVAGLFALLVLGGMGIGPFTR